MQQVTPIPPQSLPVTATATTDSQLMNQHIPVLVNALSSSLQDMIKETVSNAVLAMSTTRSSGTESNVTGVGVEQQERRSDVSDLPSVSQGMNLNINPTLAIPVREHEGSLPMSAPLPLDARVPDSTKRKIWAGEFVDMYHLLEPQKWDDYTLSVAGNEGGPTLSLQSKKRQKTFSIDEWCSAFNTFTTIYLVKYPSESGSILKYMETVRVVAQKGGDFIKFDENFRYLRQRTKMSWDWFPSELYVNALLGSNTKFTNKKVAPQSGTSTRLSDGFNIPNGFCFTYHRYGQRSCMGDCGYDHKCPKCYSFHSYTNCHMKGLSQFEGNPYRHSFSPYQSSRFRTNHNERSRATQVSHKLLQLWGFVLHSSHKSQQLQSK